MGLFDNTLTLSNRFLLSFEDSCVMRLVLLCTVITYAAL